MRRFLHRIAHCFGWYYGTVETWWQGNQLMAGFRCSTCGKISGVHPTGTTRNYLTGDD